MIQFILGTLVGVTVGVIAMCLCVASGEEDKRNGLK